MVLLVISVKVVVLDLSKNIILNEKVQVPIAIGTFKSIID